MSAFTGGRPEGAAPSSHRSPGTTSAPRLRDTRRPDTVGEPDPRRDRPEGPRRESTRTEASRTEDRRAGGPRPERRPDRPAPAPRRAARRAPATTATTATGALRGRLAAAAVAAGALATAGHGVGGLGGVVDAADPATAELAAGSLALASGASSAGSSSAGSSSGGETDDSATADAATAGVMAVPAATSADDTSTDAVAEASQAGGGQVASLTKARERAEAAAAAAEAARAPDFVKPAEGRFTSGFGARWGSQHRGVDIAGPIGTPILAVADGVVTAAGPASGFGQWVKLRHDDGTETVYGHVNRFFVSSGDEVRAGEEIAEIGNRGQSTGPHLHFEVITPGGSKINPLPWLAERGISLGAGRD